MKKKIIILLSVLCIIAGSSMVAVAQVNKEVDNIPSIVNDQILYKGETLSDSVREKLFPTLSPDQQHIAFAYSMISKEGFMKKIGIINLKTKEIVEIPLPDDNLATSWTHIGWFDSENLAVIGHVNPSLESLNKINVKELVASDTLYGVGFTWKKTDGLIYYNMPKPHFGEGEKGENKILDEKGNQYYQSPKDVIILGGPNYSEDGNNLAFFEQSLETGQIQLVTAETNNSEKLSEIKKVDWQYDIGKIRWEDNTTLKIRSLYSIDKYDLQLNKVIESTDTPEKMELEKNQK